jgi:gluconokinase
MTADGDRRILVMGVSGSGKTTVGEALAERFGVPMIEGDDFHSEANKEKMHAGIALTDEDRAPWLADIHKYLKDQPAGWVLACSALKAAYRETLFEGIAGVETVLLTGSAEVLSGRLSHRHGHFMAPELLQSQFDTLEPPKDAVVVDVAGTVEETEQKVLAGLNRQ